MPDFSGHGMVALYPRSPKTINNLWGMDPRDGGIEPETYHVTLLYLGVDEQMNDIPLDQLTVLLRNISELVPPITATLGCIGVFPQGLDGFPVYVPVSAGHITTVHNAITNEFGGYDMSAHGFTPHLTVGYTDAPVEYLTTREFVSAPVVFDRIGYDLGGIKKEFTLKG